MTNSTSTGTGSVIWTKGAQVWTGLDWTGLRTHEDAIECFSICLGGDDNAGWMDGDGVDPKAWQPPEMSTTSNDPSQRDSALHAYNTSLNG